MRKTVLAVAIGSTLAVAIVFGCSAPSPDGDFEERNRRASSSSGGSSERSDSGSRTADCSGHAKVHDDSACDTCMRESCCKFILQCDESPSCTAMLGCLEECDGDIFCVQVCHLQHEEGSRILMNQGFCAQQSCTSACESPVVDGGLFDPFGDAF